MAGSQTCYASAGEVQVAYQVLGEGPVDLVWAFGLMTHLEVKWEEPSLSAMLRRLSQFSRLILFDRRGCGLSDRGDRHVAPTLEDRLEDLVAVLDAVGSTRASVLGVSEGCALAALFASTHPDRADRLVLYGGISRLVRDDAHPWGVMEADEVEATWSPVIDGWGTEVGARAQVEVVAPSMLDDRAYLRWFARQQRQSLSRDAVGPFMRTVMEYDMDDVFPAVRAPTLVLHRTGDTAIPVSSGRRIAARIPGSTFLELDGADHLPYLGDVDAVVSAVRDFVSGEAPQEAADRRLVTLLATDAGQPGLGASVRRHLERWCAVEVSRDDGAALAMFDSATRAVRCALELTEAAADLGEDLRVGVHTGECVLGAATVSGPAAHVPHALVGLASGAREVVVSGTVRDVVAGSGTCFGAERVVAAPDLPGPLVVLTALAGGTSAPSPSVRPHVAGERGPTERDLVGPACVFRLDGELWTVAFAGLEARLRDSKGMHDLASLLADPGRERHVLDLWSGGATRPRASTPESLADGFSLVGGGQPVIDQVARDRYRRRLLELEQDLAEADDPEVVATARAEHDRLVEELAAAYGMAGRPRRVPDEVERARKAVRRRLADALRRIEQAHPALGRHLRCSVRTGVYCCYEPERAVDWQVVLRRPPGRRAGR